MKEKHRQKLLKMTNHLDGIIEYIQKREKKEKSKLTSVHPDYKKSAINLLHFRAFRSFDLNRLQKNLGYFGLSRLATSHSHIMASLLSVRDILLAMIKNKPIKMTSSTLSFKEGSHRIHNNVMSLFGPPTEGRRTRIMVTIPSEAADNTIMVEDMLKAGMNCARINCAHDSLDVWERMIKTIRHSSKKLKIPCKIAMDLAGPKIRTGAIKAGPSVLKIRPAKDIYGRIEAPLKVWLGPKPVEGLPHIPIPEADLKLLTYVDTLYFRDTRNKKRTFHLLQKKEQGYLADCPRTTFVESGMPLCSNERRTKLITTIGEMPTVEVPILLKSGDFLRLDKRPIEGENAIINKNGNVKSMAHISCTSQRIFSQVSQGEKILFDDGKIIGTITKVEKKCLIIEITQAAVNGSKLRADKGINLPDSKLTIGGLTDKDKRDLPFVVNHADIINLSFVNRPSDIRELNEELTKLNALNKVGIILKIETKTGYNQLIDIIIEAMKVHPIGVMIARGDLAVESGWENIG